MPKSKLNPYAHLIATSSGKMDKPKNASKKAAKAPPANAVARWSHLIGIGRPPEAAMPAAPAVIDRAAADRAEGKRIAALIAKAAAKGVA